MKKLIISVFALMAFSLGSTAATLPTTTIAVGDTSFARCPDGSYSSNDICEQMPDGTWR